MGLDVAHLGVEYAVCVDGAFCRTRASCCKQNRSDFISGCFCGIIRFPGGSANLIQGVAAPEPAPAHRDPGLYCFKKSRSKGSEQMRQGDADKGQRPALLLALQHPADAHARVDDNRYSAGFKKRKNQGKKLEARFYHQDGAYAA